MRCVWGPVVATLKEAPKRAPYESRYLETATDVYGQPNRASYGDFPKFIAISSTSWTFSDALGRCWMVGPLTIELPQKIPGFIGVSLIR
jgi:hypothetical protein